MRPHGISTNEAWNKYSYPSPRNQGSRIVKTDLSADYDSHKKKINNKSQMEYTYDPELFNIRDSKGRMNEKFSKQQPAERKINKTISDLEAELVKTRQKLKEQRIKSPSKEIITNMRKSPITEAFGNTQINEYKYERKSDLQPKNQSRTRSMEPVFHEDSGKKSDKKIIITQTENTPTASKDAPLSFSFAVHRTEDNIMTILRKAAIKIPTKTREEISRAFETLSETLKTLNIAHTPHPKKSLIMESDINLSKESSKKVKQIQDDFSKLRESMAISTHLIGISLEKIDIGFDHVKTSLLLKSKKRDPNPIQDAYHQNNRSKKSRSNSQTPIDHEKNMGMDESVMRISELKSEFTKLMVELKKKEDYIVDYEILVQKLAENMKKMPVSATLVNTPSNPLAPKINQEELRKKDEILRKLQIELDTAEYLLKRKKDEEDKNIEKEQKTGLILTEICNEVNNFFQSMQKLQRAVSRQDNTSIPKIKEEFEKVKKQLIDNVTSAKIMFGTPKLYSPRKAENLLKSKKEEFSSTMPDFNKNEQNSDEKNKTVTRIKIKSQSGNLVTQTEILEMQAKIVELEKMKLVNERTIRENKEKIEKMNKELSEHALCNTKINEYLILIKEQTNGIKELKGNKEKLEQENYDKQILLEQKIKEIFDLRDTIENLEKINDEKQQLETTMKMVFKQPKISKEFLFEKISQFNSTNSLTIQKMHENIDTNLKKITNLSNILLGNGKGVFYNLLTKQLDFKLQIKNYEQTVLKLRSILNKTQSEKLIIVKQLEESELKNKKIIHEKDENLSEKKQRFEEGIMQKLYSLSQKVHEKDEEIANTMQNVVELQAELDNLKEFLAERNNEYSEKCKTIQNLVTFRAKNDLEIQEKSSNLPDNNFEIENLKSKITELDEENSELAKKVIENTNKIEELAENNKNNEELINEKNTEILSLEDKISDLSVYKEKYEKLYGKIKNLNILIKNPFSNFDKFKENMEYKINLIYENSHKITEKYKGIIGKYKETIISLRINLNKKIEENKKISSQLDKTKLYENLLENYTKIESENKNLQSEILNSNAKICEIINKNDIHNENIKNQIKKFTTSLYLKYEELNKSYEIKINNNSRKLRSIQALFYSYRSYIGDIKDTIKKNKINLEKSVKTNNLLCTKISQFLENYKNKINGILTAKFEKIQKLNDLLVMLKKAQFNKINKIFKSNQKTVEINKNTEKLQFENENLIDELEACKNNNSALKLSMSQLADENKEIKENSQKKISENEATIINLQQNIENLNSELTKIKNDYEKQTQKLTGLAEKNFELQENLNNAENSVKDLEKNLQEKILNEYKEKLDNSQNEFNEKLNILNKENGNLNLKLKSLNQENEQNKRKIIEFEENEKTKGMNSDQMAQKIQLLIEEKNKLLKELENKNEVIVQNQEKITNFEQKIIDLNKNIESYNLQISENSNKFSELNQKLSDFQKENSEISQKYKELLEKCNIATQKNQFLDSEIIDLQAKISELNVQTEDLKKSDLIKNTDNELLKEQIIKINSENESLKSQLDVNNDEFDKLQSEQNNLNKDIEILKCQNINSQKEMEKKNNEISTIKVENEKIISELKNKIQEYEKSIEILKMQINNETEKISQNLNEQIFNLKNENENLKSENEKNKQNYENAQKKLSEKIAEFNSLQEFSNKQKIEFDNKISISYQEKENLSQKIASANQEIQKLTNLINEKSQKISELESIQNTNIQILSQEKEKLLKTENFNEELSKEVHELKENSQKIINENSNLLLQNNELSKKNMELIDKNTEIFNQNSELSNKNQEIQNLNNNITEEMMKIKGKIKEILTAQGIKENINNFDGLNTIIENYKSQFEQLEKEKNDLEDDIYNAEEHLLALLEIKNPDDSFDLETGLEKIEEKLNTFSKNPDNNSELEERIKLLKEELQNVQIALAGKQSEIDNLNKKVFLFIKKIIKSMEEMTNFSMKLSTKVDENEELQSEIDDIKERIYSLSTNFPPGEHEPYIYELLKAANCPSNRIEEIKKKRATIIGRKSMGVKK